MQNKVVVELPVRNKFDLVDMSGYSLDPKIPPTERAKHMQAFCPNLQCYRVGPIGVLIDYTEDAPPLQDIFTETLIRQKAV